jgi:phage-related protein (TIGR01555 family)
MARKAASTRAASAKTARSPASPAVRIGDGGASFTTDSLVNLVSGMGTGKDKTAATQFVFNEIDRASADNAYRGDWVSRKIVDIPAYDSTREWRSWEAETKDITDLEDAEKNLSLQLKLMHTMRKARLYGGAALIMGVDQGKPEEPLELDKLGKDCLKFVHSVSRYEITAGEIEWDITSPYYGQPKSYSRVSPTAGSVTLHPSRVIRFVGQELPDPSQANNGWGDSVLSIVQDAIIQLGTVSGSLAQLVQESKVDIVSIPELSERIRSAEYEGRLKTRFAMASTMKSVFSLLLIDKEESWQRLQANLAGMPEVMQAYMLMCCGAADIPATRFLGQSPAGMNATGDSDTRNYYDARSTDQKVFVTPTLKPLDDVLQISVFGQIVDGLTYHWNPLWQMSDAERAAIAVQKATVMTADVNAGLIDPMVLQKGRENQLIEDQLYPGLEQIIDEYGTDFDERQAEQEAAAAEQAAILAQQQQGTDPNNNAPVEGKPGAKKPANSNVPPPPGKQKPPAKAVKDANGKRSMLSGKFAAAASLGNSYEDYVMHQQASSRRAMSRKAWETRKGMQVNVEAIDGMLQRIKDATTPRPLYVYRPVLNWKDIAAFYKKAGLKTTVAEEMHVTVIYSKKAVDWIKVGEDDYGNDENGELLIKEGGPRVMERFNEALVLAFASSALGYRHNSAEYRAGCDWAYEDYTPHVTISYDAGAVDIRNLPAYTGPIELGPEVFEEIKGSFDPATLEES